MCLLFCFTSLAACGGGNNDNVDGDGNVVTDKSKILDIGLWNSGYGVDWIYALAEDFKSTHPGIAINISAKSGNTGTGLFYNTITTGVGANDTDLYFAYGPKYLQYVTGEYSSNKLLESLNDVLDYTAEGESKSVKEKIGNSILDALVYDNGTESVTYAVPYVNGISGIVYNAKLFEEYNLQVPRTTNELKNVADTAIEETPYNGRTQGASATAKKAVFIHVPGYWQSAVIAWWLQYAGQEKFNDFWTFADVDVKNMSEYKDVHYQEGLKKALNVLYNLITPEGATYVGSNTLDYTVLQSRFLENEDALMYSCGSWLETEMKKGEDFDSSTMDNFKMMKYPVISDIKDKLSEGNRTESKLVELIDYVDGVKERPSWATDDDVALISYARNCSTTQTASATATIPSYSPAKELAKEFLKYFYSDRAMKIFAEKQHCALMVTPDDSELYDDLNKNEWSSFSKSVFDLSLNTKDYVATNLSHPLYYRTNLTELFRSTPEANFTNVSATDRKNVSQFLDSEWSELMSQWSVYLSASGL